MSNITRYMLGLAAVFGVACSPALPDPESPGAQLYRTRCGGCHRLYAPGALTAAMWEMQLDRMQAEMTRRGVRPLDVTERATVLQYLRTHGSDAVPAEADS